MTIRSMRTAGVVAVVVCLPVYAAGAASAEPARRVTVVGKASGTGLKAEEEAMLKAQRTALEQVCGTFINSMSKTKDYQTVYDKVLAEASGFARVVKVIETEKADGMTFVKAEIEVFPDTFRRKWKVFAHIKESEDNPRCVLVVLEDPDTTDNKPHRPNGVVQSQLEGFFIDKDVQLMDKAISEDVRTRDLQLAALNDDINKLASTGAAFKAEVVILGRAEATPSGASEIGGIRVHRWRGVLTIRAIQTDSAKILMSRQYELSKSTTGRRGGGSTALAALAKEHEAKILTDIGKAWRKRATNRRIIRLTVRPMSYAEALMLAEQIKKLDGTAEARLREVIQNSADIEVDWKNKIDDLATHLMELELENGGKIEITERTANRLIARTVK